MDKAYVATGADVFVPKAFGNAAVLTVADVPAASFKDKENIVVIGGGLVGCEAALGLAMQGHEVTVLEMRDDVAMDLNMMGSAPGRF